MRILVLNYEFPPLGGGGAPVSKEIAKGYVQNGHQVSVVTMGFGGLPRFETVEGVDVYRVPCLRSKKNICHPWEQLTYLVSGAWFLFWHLKKAKYDVCHAHFIIPTGLLAAWAKLCYGIPFIVTGHGSDVPGYNPDRFQFLHHFTPPVIRFVLGLSSKFIAPSEYYLKLVSRQYECLHGRCLVIPNGLHAGGFWPKEKRDIILSSGRLLRRKGFHTLVNAAKKSPLPFEVHIVGDGPDRQELEALAKGAGTKIVFHGWLDNHSGAYRDLLGEAAIFVLVSEMENASISLLEAMFSGCAVVTANVTGCAETVGSAGITLPPNDELRLNQLLVQLCQRPEEIKSWGEKAIQRTKGEYEWAPLVRQYLSCLQSAVASSTPAIVPVNYSPIQEKS